MKSKFNKATHERIELWQDVIKSSDGKYLAVLSDDSIDRDDEIVGKQALQGIMDNDGYTAILLNHKNDVLGQIGEWINKRIEIIDGKSSFVAEPKFYESNPNARIIKGCLDEGAKYGISIGAIPKAWEEVKRDGRTHLVYTELELLEASFVAIPSNRSGRAARVAKMFNKNIGGIRMEKEFTQKDLDSKVDKKVDEITADFKKQLELKDTEIAKAKEDVKKSIEASEEVKKASEELSKKLEEATETQKTADEEIEKLKKMSVLKGDNSTLEGEEKAKAEFEKAFESGAIPVVRN